MHQMFEPPLQEQTDFNSLSKRYSNQRKIALNLSFQKENSLESLNVSWSRGQVDSKNLYHPFIQ